MTNAGVSQHFAYVTLVMRGDKYIPGALALAYSLKVSGTRADVICMVTDDVDRTKLDRERLFDKIIVIPYIRHASKLTTDKQKKIYASWIDDSFTKWNCLRFTEYSKVCFVDADIIFRSCPDSVFDKRAPGAVFSLPWTFRSAKDVWYRFDRRRRIGPDLIRRALSEKSTVGGAGFMLLEPNIPFFEKIQEVIGRRAAPYGHDTCISAPDEQSIAEASAESGMQWTFLSPGYSAILRHPEWTARETIIGVHYISADKPWMFTRGKWPDFAEWWDLWDRMTGRARPA
jgi:alpha-N-acetylglucosamine transferase